MQVTTEQPRTNSLRASPKNHVVCVPELAHLWMGRLGHLSTDTPMLSPEGLTSPQRYAWTARLPSVTLENDQDSKETLVPAASLTGAAGNTESRWAEGMRNSDHDLHSPPVKR